mgnify:CR=1 FL=1
MTDQVPDYCPFCGARLHDNGLDAHFDRHDDCAERFAAWRDDSAGGTTAGDDGVSGNTQTALLAVIVGLVLTYSVLVAGQPLLGIAASVIVVLAFVAVWR